MRAFVTGAAVWGPGLAGWSASRAVLAGEAPYVAGEGPVPVPVLLSATERRRTGVAVRLALTVAQEATAMAGVAPGAVRCVFGSSNGDGAAVHAILETLAGADRQVSPTQFHNSVHNAAAGYWSIGTGSGQPATCLGCHDGTFAAALLKAMAELEVEGGPVLLCVSDAPLPEPLAARRPTGFAFAVGLVLAGERGARALAELGVGYVAAAPAVGAEAPRAEALRALVGGNPAARALRLFEALAGGRADACSAGLLDGRVDIEVRPCSGARAS